ncbi:sterol regulatory element binding protein cleavage-activating protein [Lyophyllum atratum]|nr:sterol regulatory element binding protein cleavage-activating protein [Lyophyllum atratum]
MFDHVNHIVRWSRTLGHRLFLRFGLHCATHQIRIILVSCVVITSLFYPALAIYTSSEGLSIIDTFITPSTLSAFDAQQDLVDLWSYPHSLRIHNTSVFRAKCSVGRALRVERALTRHTLLSTLELENHLETLISGTDTPCLKRPDGKCFVLSPLLYWNHDRDALLSDTNVSDTLSPSKNISFDGITVTPQMVLACRHMAGSKFNSAKFLAVTYFFPESECTGTSEHAEWLQSVHRALDQETPPAVQTKEPAWITLEYNDLDVPKGEGWSALSAFLYLAYIGFFAYVAWSVAKMTAVHSRLGVTFTALVEIAVSTITSLSVCALVGFKITMVPWEILPIVIVFVGAENMFNLVDAVSKTSVTLSVKQRIAEGLSRAGTSNTLKVVSYNAILGVIAVFSVGAIRQFCSFAIVVLVAHWFLAHTFFVAVLSIDLQRLTLDELLRSSTAAPSIPQLPKENISKKPRSAWQKFIFSTQNLLRGRATTNLSLLMLLAITGTLYYTTYTSTVVDEQTTGSQLGGFPQPLVNIAESGLNNRSGAWPIWKTLNPAHIHTPLLHLRVEVPNIVKFRPSAYPTDTVKYQVRPRQRFSMRTFQLGFWLLKIMVLPIAATTSALWGLLLYLLKNAELLEAQRNRAEPDAPDSEEDLKALGGHIAFSTLPRAFTSDVELIAASKDGNVVVSVGLHNEISIWRVDTQTHVSIDAADVLLRAASTSSAVSTLTSVAVDTDGHYFAERALSYWPLTKAASAANWSLKTGLVDTYFVPSRRVQIVKCSLVHVYPMDRFFVAFSLNDGTLEMVDTVEGDPLIAQDFCVQAGDGIYTASKVHACQAELGGIPRLIVAVATEAGLITLWDGSNGECISVFDDVYGSINRLRVTPVHCETCFICAFSVDYVVRFFRLRCSCSRHQLRNVSSRSNSTTSQLGARLATTFEASAFPVSGHGVHSRRASEKDTGRRDEYDSDTRPLSNPLSYWRDAVLVRVMDITCERGGWGVNGRRLIAQGGTASALIPASTHGLTTATLERWELWTFDPSVSRLQSSLLAALTINPDRAPPCSSSSSEDCVPRLPFTRVTPLLIAPTHALAGFGNTIGLFHFCHDHVQKYPCQG